MSGLHKYEKTTFCWFLSENKCFEVLVAVGQAFFSMPRLRISALNVWILGKDLGMPPGSLGCRAVCHPSDRSATLEL